MKQRYVIPSFTAPGIFVNTPGNLSDLRRKDRLDRMVAELEHLPEALGPTATKYFLRDLEDFSAAFADADLLEESEEVGRANLSAGRSQKLDSFWRLDGPTVQAFLDWPEYSFWRGFMKINNTTPG